MPRCTKAEKILRDIEMSEMIARGLPLKDIFRFTSEKWKITIRQSQNYYYRILKEMTGLYRRGKEYLYAEIKVKYEKLYYVAFKENNYNVCRQVLSDIAKIEGLITDKDKDDDEVAKKPINVIVNLITEKQEADNVINREIN